MKIQSKITSKNFDDILNQIITTNQQPQIQSSLESQLPLPPESSSYTIENVNDTLHEPSSDNLNDTNDNSNNLNHKMDLILLNNGWNDKNERIVISIGENAASYKWMHEKSAVYYKTIHKILSIITIVFTTALSAETILNNNDEYIVKIFQQIVTYIVTLLSVLQNFLKYEQLTEQHSNSANSFSQLYHEIQQQMCMYRRNRINATNYVSETLKSYDSLIVNGPNIPNRIVSQFKQTFRNTDISVPDIADRIQKIEIISEPINTNVFSNINKTINTNTHINENNNIVTKNIENANDKRYGRQGLCNLQEIHNVFQIHGDISDNDIQHADEIQLKQLRNKFLSEKSTFENNRYLQHSKETD